MRICKTLPLLILLCTSSHLFSHPSSGLVVNSQGEIFFVHTSRGVAKIDRDRNLTYIHSSTGGHWLCLDPDGAYSRTQPKHFKRITPDGLRPAIIFADGGAPIAVSRDGHLYYGSGWGGAHEHDPGADTISRISTHGTISAVSPKLKEVLASQRAGVTGLAAAHDGSIYISSAVSILRLGTNGLVTTIVERPDLKDCDADPPPDGLPGFRGIDISTNGTIYAAATGCRNVVKISSDGSIQTLLQSEPPWSPTAVAAHGDDLYILEWTNANKEPDSDWRPRVRKLDKSGTISTLLTITENAQINRR